MGNGRRRWHCEGTAAHKWGGWKIKCSHCLKWVGLLEVGPYPVILQLILAGVDSFMFLRNVTYALVSPAQCERNTNEPGVQGDCEVPRQMAQRLWRQQASMCNAELPVWMSPSISHRLPSMWGIRWYLTLPVAMLIVEVSLLKGNMFYLFLSDSCWHCECSRFSS